MADGSGDAVLGDGLPRIYGNGEDAKVSLRDYLDAIRAGDIALQQERDRRYSEIAVEREKALKIKETADLAALQLARDIQTYKDEKANELRDQINNERGLYVTRSDLIGLQRFTVSSLIAVAAVISTIFSIILLVHR